MTDNSSNRMLYRIFTRFDHPFWGVYETFEEANELAFQITAEGRAERYGYGPLSVKPVTPTPELEERMRKTAKLTGTRTPRRRKTGLERLAKIAKEAR